MSTSIIHAKASSKVRSTDVIKPKSSFNNCFNCFANISGVCKRSFSLALRSFSSSNTIIRKYSPMFSMLISLLNISLFVNISLLIMVCIFLAMASFNALSSLFSFILSSSAVVNCVRTIVTIFSTSSVIAFDSSGEYFWFTCSRISSKAVFFSSFTDADVLAVNEVLVVSSPSEMVFVAPTFTFISFTISISLIDMGFSRSMVIYFKRFNNQ